MLISMSVALLCGLFISYVYRLTYSGSSYSASYVNSLVAFTMITTIVVMIIGNNLARAFGLVGAMSIIRFRMAIKDTMDIVFIFFVLAVGMASGVQLYSLAISSTLFICIIIILLSDLNYGAPRKREYLLQFHFSSEDDEATPYVSILRKFCKKYKLVNIKSIGDTDIMELSYYITLRKQEHSKEFIRQISHIEGVRNINFFFDEE